MNPVNSYKMVVFDSVPGAGKSTIMDMLVKKIVEGYGSDHHVLFNGELVKLQDYEKGNEKQMTQELVLEVKKTVSGRCNDFIRDVYDPTRCEKTLHSNSTIGLNMLNDILKVSYAFPYDASAAKGLIMVYERNHVTAFGLFFVTGFYNARMHSKRVGRENYYDFDFDLVGISMDRSIDVTKTSLKLLKGLKTLIFYFETDVKFALAKVKSRARMWECDGLDEELMTVLAAAHDCFFNNPGLARTRGLPLSTVRFLRKNVTPYDEFYEADNVPTVKKYNVDWLYNPGTTEDVLEERRKNNMEFTLELYDEFSEWM